MDKYQKFNEMLVDLHHAAVASGVEFMAFCQADAKTHGLYGTLNCTKPVLMSILCNVMEQEFDVEEITIMAGAVLARKAEKESVAKD